MKQEAKDKLEKEYKSGKYDHYGNAMKKEVYEAIGSFIEQDEEFAQAVAQGGTFEECMKAVAKGVGQSISDKDAYEKAVRFYFPGAKVRFQMTVDLIGDAAAPQTEEKAGMILDLSAFF